MASVIVHCQYLKTSSSRTTGPSSDESRWGLKSFANAATTLMESTSPTGFESTSIDSLPKDAPRPRLRHWLAGREPGLAAIFTSLTHRRYNALRCDNHPDRRQKREVVGL